MCNDVSDALVGGSFGFPLLPDGFVDISKLRWWSSVVHMKSKVVK
jgi:hypothetical protein